ncbi:protein LAX PANICLE 2-like isoform X2 [Miscanthus floridulus]|uniref:protein LAX PANICLE 2-like isoform X2 n=1 Tax=Miscanthus floridulus TaxID=154761 RepID=UPI00345A4D84
MVPTTRNLFHHDGKSSRGRSCYHPGQYYVGIAAQLEASAASARQQDQNKPSRSPRLLAMADDDEPTAAAGPSTSPPGGAGAGNDWLQLGLAAAASSSSSYASSSGDNNSTDPTPAPAPPAPMELDLFAYDKRNARMRPPLFPLPLRSYHQSYGGGRGRYRPAEAASGSMSAPFLPFMPPFRCSGDTIRVISPPRRTETPGLWLTLQAAPNQVREPILPQIAKSYLRINNMKVEVVMKYLAEKLGIARSHQVELTCRGQVLPPLLLVKYVRETIWCSTAPRDEEADLTSRRSSAATDHVMTLCYSTSRNSKLAPLHL